MIGAGASAGGSDAANLLKPALARRLRTIAATTWSEYKKYFEKDAAASRRFQPVKVEEPSREVAIDMLRGLAVKLQAAHGVHICDEAVVTAVDLSRRYIPGRLCQTKRSICSTPARPASSWVCRLVLPSWKRCHGR
ncbi:MAG: hypothetical protein U0787_23485 [Polyangia bacterium]